MKMKFLFIAILVSGLFFSTGCEKVKSLLDTTFDANYSVNINMNVPASGNVKNLKTVYAGSATIDPTSDPDVAKYLKLIKSWDVTGLTGTFSNVTKEATIKSATLTFSSSSVSGTATWSFSNFQIKNGATITLDNDNGQWDILSQILSAKKPFKVSFSIDTDDNGFSYTLKVKIKSKVTANPLGSK